MFGFLAVREAKVAFQYIFCVTNSLQGLFIFLMHVVKTKQSRLLWSRIFFCCAESAGAGKEKNSTSLSEFSPERNRTIMMTLSEDSPHVKKKSLPPAAPADDVSTKNLGVEKPEMSERKISSSSIQQLLEVHDDERYDSTSTLVSNVDAPAAEKRHILSVANADDVRYSSTDDRPPYLNSENDIKLILPDN